MEPTSDNASCHDADSGASDREQVQNSGSVNSTAKIVIQQCLSAKLMVRPASGNTPPEYVKIGQGAVIYVCFLQGATSETISSIVKSVVNIRLCETAAGKFVSVLSLPGDVLIVPQATLGGRAKGPMMQYHRNVDKTLGEQLYNEFVRLVEEKVEQNAASVEKNCSVKHGTYGNRQVLKLDTNGPFTHVLDF